MSVPSASSFSKGSLVASGGPPFAAGSVYKVKEIICKSHCYLNRMRDTYLRWNIVIEVTCIRWIP